MEIVVRTTVIESVRNFKYDIEEMGYSLEQWETFTADQKNELIQEWVDDENDQPFWSVESFITK